MNQRTDSPVDRIAARARDRYQTLVNDARSQTVQAAGRVRDSKRPVQKLSSLGIELSNISHRATRNVLRSQTRLIEHQIDAFAGRLHAAARATSVRSLLRDQIRLIPENASRLIEDTRQTLSAVASAGGEVRSVVTSAVTDMRRSDSSAAATSAPAAETAPVARPAAKVARRKAPRRKTAKKSAKKTASARKPRKKTARKVAKTTANRRKTKTAARRTTKSSDPVA